MKGYREIKRILTEQLGFHDLAAYKKWVTEVRPTTRPTAEAIASLSPDVVDCRAFWKVCDELFGTDPVGNLTVPLKVGRLPFAVESIMDVNRMNLRLASSLGITAFLEENADARLRVLEVGAGYGALRSFIETHTNHKYVGVDAVRRVEGVVETTPDGLLPRSLVEGEEGTYSYVVSTNVFQHLSARQREAYIADARTLLHEGGLLMFTLTVDTGKFPPFSRDAEGRAWATHYGQYTPIPDGPAAYGLVAEGWRTLYVTQRFDSIFCFICQKQ